MRILMTSVVDLKKSQHNRPHEFVRYLSRRHEVTVLSINDWWKARQYDSTSYCADLSPYLEKVNYRYFTEIRINPYLQEFIFKKNSIEITKRNFDAHLNYNSLIAGHYISKKLNTIFDLSDDLIAMIKHSPQIPTLLRPFGSSIGNYYLKKNINNSKLVTVTTSFLRDKYSLSKEKFKIIPNGVDTKCFKYDKNAKNDLDLNNFIVGYVGVLREWVDLEPVFKAFTLLNKEIKLIIVGKEGNFQHNLDLVKKYGIADRVIFKGVIPYSQIPKYISAMDVCLIPFKINDISSNALPLKLFEYMACEKPVISTRLSTVYDTIGNIIFYVNNHEDYASTINMLYENRKKAIVTGREGRLFIQNNYAWDIIVKNLETALVNLAY